MTVQQVPIDLIRPGRAQARRYFDAERLRELADSIRESGVVQPVVLRTRAPGYELLAGERRWRAAQLAGLHEIPAIVRDDLPESEALVIGLIENLQRESLTPMEAAAGLKQLGEAFGLTHQMIGEKIGKSREYVTNHLRLLNLTAPVQALVNEGHVSLGHAKILAGLAPGAQGHWAGEIVAHQLSVRALERRIAGHARAHALPARPKAADWQALERRLSDHFGYPVTVSAKSGRGELRVRFHSLDELDGILERIGFNS